MSKKQNSEETTILPNTNSETDSTQLIQEPVTEAITVEHVDNDNVETTAIPQYQTRVFPQVEDQTQVLENTAVAPENTETEQFYTGSYNEQPTQTFSSENHTPHVDTTQVYPTNTENNVTLTPVKGPLFGSIILGIIMLLIGAGIAVLPFFELALGVSIFSIPIFKITVVSIAGLIGIACLIKAVASFKK